MKAHDKNSNLIINNKIISFEKIVLNETQFNQDFYHIKPKKFLITCKKKIKLNCKYYNIVIILL